MCFGVPINAQIGGLILGLIIIIWGVSELIGFRFNFWALVAIVFGALILIGAFRGRTFTR